MKKAFTLLELVFVIVIIGILATQFFKTSDNNNLQLAANQVISHIRYTQHLAMMDDKFDANDDKYFKQRWQIRFVQNLVYTAGCPTETRNNIWSYMIYSNQSTSDNNPNKSEIAVNPMNKNELLSGGYNNDLCIDNSYNPVNQQSSSSMRLQEKFGINDVTFSGGCRSNINYISFDYLGRPFNSFPTTTPYELASSGWHKLLNSQCVITLCTNDDCSLALDNEKIQIYIEPETGYTHF